MVSQLQGLSFLKERDRERIEAGEGPSVVTALTQVIKGINIFLYMFHYSKETHKRIDKNIIL